MISWGHIIHRLIRSEISKPELFLRFCITRTISRAVPSAFNSSEMIVRTAPAYPASVATA